MTVSTTLLASGAVLRFGIMCLMGAVAVVEMGFSFMSFRCIKLSTMHSFDLFPQWWRVGVTFCASWSFASVRFLQGGENVCKVLKAKKNQRRKKKSKQQHSEKYDKILFHYVFSMHSFDVFSQWWRVSVTFWVSWRNSTLIKLQDAQNVIQTLHHCGNTSKLCMVLSFMHQKDIMKQTLVKFPTVQKMHLFSFNIVLQQFASLCFDKVDSLNVCHTTLHLSGLQCHFQLSSILNNITG